MGRIRKPPTDDQRLARRLYRQMPEVRAKKALRRAMKLHQTPKAINYGPAGRR